MNTHLQNNNPASKPALLYANAKPFLQAKLTVNTPGDQYEQEADAMADRVMRMSSHETAKPVTGLIGKSLQRKCAHCEEEEKKKKPIMRKAEAGNSGTSVSSSFASSLNASKGGGSPLPQVTRSFMENAFSADFSSVKIHTGSQASEMSRGINAKAFTYGNDIYFMEGQFNPNSSGGMHLLLHELTHVVQQGQTSLLNTQHFIQRSTRFTAGNVHEVKNLAEEKLGTKTYGITYFVLNGTSIAGNGIADSRAALKKPTLTFLPITAGEVESKLDTVPMNEGSFNKNVLTSGPWSIGSTKGRVKTEFASMPANCTGNVATTFTAKGKPSDADMHAKNRKHEDHHVADHKIAFNNNIVPWDVKLTQAKTQGTTYHGEDNAKAEAALFAAMGGAPNEIAQNLAIGLIQSNREYHATPNGGGILWSDEVANRDCSACSAKGFNPA